MSEEMARYEKASQMVSDLCQGERKWLMSIPARRDYDPDLVIQAALEDVKRLIQERDTLRQQVEQLQHQTNLMRTPCQCDPLGSGEEFCNGGCELRQQVASLQEELKFTEAARMELFMESGGLRVKLVMARELAQQALPWVEQYYRFSEDGAPDAWIQEVQEMIIQRQRKQETPHASPDSEAL